MTIQIPLRATGSDMKEPVFIRTAGRIDRSKRLDLVDALVELEPDAFTGDYEADQVVFVLGEIGDVWPESIREAA